MDGGDAGLWVAAELIGLFSIKPNGTSPTRAFVGCDFALSVGVDPANPGAVAVGCEDGKVRVTTDGGDHWSPVDAGVRGIATALL